MSEQECMGNGVIGMGSALWRPERGCARLTKDVHGHNPRKESHLVEVERFLLLPGERSGVAGLQDRLPTQLRLQGKLHGNALTTLRHC